MIPLDKPVTCPVLIGRTAHLESLERALHEVCGGRGQTVLICGEAGIGKSRLLAEARARAAASNWSILQGNCYEPDRSFPYAPLLDLLRGHVAGQAPEAVAQEVGPAAPELVKLLPELATLLPGLAPSPALEPEQERRRLFHTLAQFIAGLAIAQPLLLIVEDLHWSDDASLELLAYLARRIRSQPIALLLTYRSDETHPSLDHFLADLARERLAAELRLERLSKPDVEAMLRAIFELQRPVRADFLEAIYALSEGNPFFIEEVLGVLVAAGDIYYVEGGWDRKPLGELRIPRTIQDAVQRRLERVSEAARHAAALAAVAGRRFDFALLREVAGRDELGLLALIKELIGAQLVVEESVDQFAFRHALTRQAIYTDLLARERRALHRQSAEAMERLYAAAPDAHLGDLAYHYSEAGSWAKALEYARRAGERAQALYAPRAAVEHFTRALDAAHRLTLDPSPEVYRARGLAYETLGNFERARADHEAALALARSAENRRAEWQALLDLGFLWAGRDYARTGEYFRRALELARALGDPRSVAHSLNRIGNWHLNVEEPLEAERHHREALIIFEDLEDARGIAETLDLLAVTSYLRGDLIKSATYYRQAIALFRELDDRHGLATGLVILMLCGGNSQTDTIVPATTSPAEQVRAGELAFKLAREIGWRSGEAFALTHLAYYLGLRGEYARALELAESGLAIAEEVEHRQWMTAAHCALGTLHLDLLALPAAQECLERALALAKEIGSLNWVRQATGPLASAFILQNELERAESVLDAAFGPDTPAHTVGQRLVWRARAELALARGDPSLALDIADRLLRSAPNAADGDGIPRLSQLRGEALAVLQRVAEAEAALHAAQGAAVAQGARPLLWRIHAACGALYRAQARPEDAEQAFSAARTIIEELAANVPAGPLRSNFLHQATALLPRPRPISPRRAAKQAFGGLTAREREVAAEIVRGKTNREIADALVVGERTIETHVGNILSKLGLTSRRQIAAWAAQKGLGEDAE